MYFCRNLSVLVLNPSIPMRSSGVAPNQNVKIDCFGRLNIIFFKSNNYCILFPKRQTFEGIFSYRLNCNYVPGITVPICNGSRRSLVCNKLREFCKISLSVFQIYTRTFHLPQHPVTWKRSVFNAFQTQKCFILCSLPSPTKSFSVYLYKKCL